MFLNFHISPLLVQAGGGVVALFGRGQLGVHVLPLRDRRHPRGAEIRRGCALRHPGIRETDVKYPGNQSLFEQKLKFYSAPARFLTNFFTNAHPARG